MKLKKIDVSEEILLDITQIAEGVYSPLRGFMNKKELNSVLQDYRLPNGVVWTLPIIFQLPKRDITFRKGDRVAIGRKGGSAIAVAIVNALIEIAKKL